MISTKNILIATLLMSGSLLALGGITAVTSGALFADEANSEIDASVEQNNSDTSVETTDSDNSLERVVFD